MVDESLALHRAAPHAAGKACYLTTSGSAATPQKIPLPAFFDRARRMR
jgi:hypothetical protein